MNTIRIGQREVSRFILGTNPFSGFSHQSVEMDRQMVAWFTMDRCKALLREAETLGVNTVIARTDLNVMRLMREYWDEGGKLVWFAQTCPPEGPPELCIQRANEGGAVACHLHGGYMDHCLANNNLEQIPGLIEMIRSAGLVPGVAAHNPKVIEWAEKNLDVDYYMCCYYNSMPRDDRPEHVHGSHEWFWPEDRDIMTRLIQMLSKPAIHYKILAAGRNEPAEAFAYAAKSMRAGDAVCVGVYTEGNPDMLREDVELLEASLGR